MIIYVDLEHKRLQGHAGSWSQSRANCLETKYRLEQISGDICLIVHYSRLTPVLLHDLNIQAVLVSGCQTDYEHYAPESLAGLRAVYLEAAWPTLGFCAGMQLLAQTYGAEIGPIGPLAPGDPDPYQGRYIPGMKQERGFMPARLNHDHLLFDGLKPQSSLFQDHYWEIKTLPAGFQALGQSDLCPLQAIAHTDLPLFGLQFHPERYNDLYPDGRKILENFFRFVGGYTILTASLQEKSDMAAGNDLPDMANAENIT